MSKQPSLANIVVRDEQAGTLNESNLEIKAKLRRKALQQLNS